MASQIEVLTAEATGDGHITITVIDHETGGRDTGHLTILDLNDTVVATGMSASPYPGVATEYTVPHIPNGQYKATFYSETYSEYVNYILVTVGNPDSQLYWASKLLDDVQDYSLEDFSTAYQPAVTSVNLPALVDWAKASLPLTTALYENNDLESIVVMKTQVLGTYSCYVTPYLVGGESVSPRTYAASSSSELASLVANETGITLAETSGMTATRINLIGVSYKYQTKQINQLYGSVESQRTVYEGTIRQGQAGDILAFDSDVFSTNPKIQAMQKTIVSISAAYSIDHANPFRVDVTFDDQTSQALITYTESNPDSPTDYGITMGQQEETTG